MGVLLVLFGGLLVLFGAAVLRISVGRAFGVKGMRPAITFNHPGFSAVSSIGRVAVALSGLVGSYLAVALLFMLALALGGTTKIDETSMRVMVAPHGPADRAGIMSGDRIVAVDDRAIGDWGALKSEIAKHAGDDVAVKVERDGAQRIIHVTPGERGSNASGKILVGPYYANERVGIGDAMATGLVMPTTIWKTTLRGFVRIFAGKETAELSGPVAIAHEANAVARNSIADGLRLAGGLLAYLFFIPIILTIVMFPRRRQP